MSARASRAIRRARATSFLVGNVVKWAPQRARGGGITEGNDDSCGLQVTARGSPLAYREGAVQITLGNREVTP